MAITRAALFCFHYEYFTPKFLKSYFDNHCFNLVGTCSLLFLNLIQFKALDQTRKQCIVLECCVFFFLICVCQCFLWGVSRCVCNVLQTKYRVRSLLTNKIIFVINTGGCPFLKVSLGKIKP